MSRLREMAIAVGIGLTAGLLGGCPGDIEDPQPFLSGLRTCQIEGDVRDIVPRIFRERCGDAVACHGNPDEMRVAARLNLVDPDLESRLINIPAMGDEMCADRLRIVPGVPNESYLLEKIEAVMPSCGDRMPLGQEPLTRQEVNCIADWIYQVSADVPPVADAGGGEPDAGAPEVDAGM